MSEARTLVIEPVTRVEGHSKVMIYLDDDGKVKDARFQVTQFRGFEKFCEGRHFTEMPGIMARICGICPVSHLIASAKACDALLAVTIPPAAEKLRRLIGAAQVVQSHALSLFYLSCPDLLFGMDAPPGDRSLLGVYSKHPELARDGIALRKFGQQIIERLGGKRIHPAWIVPGGVSKPLSDVDRDAILTTTPEALAIALRSLKWLRDTTERFREEIATFGFFPSLFMGLANRDGGLEFYDGHVRFVNERGQLIEERDPSRYFEYLGERCEPWTYLKSAYYLGLGYPDGIYRVGPLARLNLCSHCGTPLADKALAEFRRPEEGTALSSFYYHQARLIEIIYCVELIEQLLSDPEILSHHVRSIASPNSFEGVGVAEAPRGTLFHHYKIDENGLISWANLIIATGHNTLPIGRSVLQVARQYIKSEKITPGMLNRVEAVIRAYDPCLSCATHALGDLALKIQIIGPQGQLIDEVSRP